MNTKTKVMSVLMIGVVAMAAGAGTMAYFSDTETSSGNTFTAGIMDLDSSGIDTVDMAVSAGEPGTNYPNDLDIDMTSASTLTPDHTQLAVETSNFNDGTPTDADFSNIDVTTASGKTKFKKHIIITKFVYEGEDFLAGTTPGTTGSASSPASDVYLDDTDDDDGDGNTEVSLQDLEAAGVIYSATLPDKDDDTTEFDFKFSGEAGNGFQGDSFDLDFEVGVPQVSGQQVLT